MKHLQKKKKRKTIWSKCKNTERDKLEKTQKFNDGLYKTSGTKPE